MILNCEAWPPAIVVGLDKVKGAPRENATQPLGREA
jgi:hypothetical protein